MRPEIDRQKFASAIVRALESEGLSGRAASRLPGLNPAMVSRAVNEHVLSAASMLMLCRVFRLDPFAFLISEDHMPDQAVTAIVPRETSSGRASQ